MINNIVNILYYTSVQVVISIDNFTCLSLEPGYGIYSFYCLYLMCTCTIFFCLYIHIHIYIYTYFVHIYLLRWVEYNVIQFDLMVITNAIKMHIFKP